MSIDNYTAPIYSTTHPAILEQVKHATKGIATYTEECHLQTKFNAEPDSIYLEFEEGKLELVKRQSVKRDTLSRDRIHRVVYQRLEKGQVLRTFTVKRRGRADVELLCRTIDQAFDERYNTFSTAYRQKEQFIERTTVSEIRDAAVIIRFQPIGNNETSWDS